MDERYDSLNIMLNLSFRCDNKRWLGRAGSLHIPPVVLTPGMKGHFEDSVYEIHNNMDIMDERVVPVLMRCYQNLLRRLQKIAKI